MNYQTFCENGYCLVWRIVMGKRTDDSLFWVWGVRDNRSERNNFLWYSDGAEICWCFWEKRNDQMAKSSSMISHYRSSSNMTFIVEPFQGMIMPVWSYLLLEPSEKRRRMGHSPFTNLRWYNVSTGSGEYFECEPPHSFQIPVNLWGGIGFCFVSGIFPENGNRVADGANVERAEARKVFGFSPNSRA